MELHRFAEMTPAVKGDRNAGPTAAREDGVFLTSPIQEEGALPQQIDCTLGGTVGAHQRAPILVIEIDEDAFHTLLHAWARMAILARAIGHLGLGAQGVTGYYNVYQRDNTGGRGEEFLRNC